MNGPIHNYGKTHIANLSNLAEFHCACQPSKGNSTIYKIHSPLAALGIAVSTYMILHRMLMLSKRSALSTIGMAKANWICTISWIFSTHSDSI